MQVERGEFQQESALKQLEVLQEEEKEYQHIKVQLLINDSMKAPKEEMLSCQTYLIFDFFFSSYMCINVFS